MAGRGPSGVRNVDCGGAPPSCQMLQAPRMPQELAQHNCLPTRVFSPKVRAFVDFFIDRTGPGPYWDRRE